MRLGHEPTFFTRHAPVNGVPTLIGSARLPIPLATDSTIGRTARRKCGKASRARAAMEARAGTRLVSSHGSLTI